MNEETPNKPHSIQKWLWPVVVLLLLGGGAYIWWWQQQNVDSLNSKINDLNGQIEILSIVEQPQPVVNDSTSIYTAQVGKFTLKLDDYAIVVLHDDGAEGSPLTKLLIAEPSAPGVVKSNMYEKAELTAVQYGLHNTTFEEAVKMRLDTSYTKLPSVTIDGVTAEVYKVEGLDYTKKVFFGKGEILYDVELTFTNEKTDKMLEAIIKGFTFN